MTQNSFFPEKNKKASLFKNLVINQASALPTPPAGAAIPLVRADSRVKFRVGEAAYFSCQDT